MTKLSALFLASLAVLPLCADDNPDYISYDGQTVVGQQQPSYVTTINLDGSTNVWTAADLVAALQLLNRKYHREVEHPSGRVAWHGELVREEVDTEREVKREIHEDGTVFEIPFRARSKSAPKPATLNADGVPVALARARERREAEKATTNTVTVVTAPSTP